MSSAIQKIFVFFWLLILSSSILRAHDFDFRSCSCERGTGLLNIENQQKSDSSKRVSFLLGAQVEGSTILAPMAGFEFRISDRWSARTSLTVAFHHFYESISFEFIQKVRLNFKISKWGALTFGSGIGYLINPVYVKDPADPRFNGCGMYKCPTTWFFAQYSLGLQFTPFRKSHWQFNPIFNFFSYTLSQSGYPLKSSLFGQYLTIEINYKFL